MPIDQESKANFQRGLQNDGYLGVVDTTTNMLYLALATPLDGSTIDRSRYSTINGATIDPLPGAGGHGRLAQAAGINATQIAPGVANGTAFGFSLVKNGPSQFKIGTFRSGFNTQDLTGERPGFAQNQPDEARTLAQGTILNTLLPMLTKELMADQRKSV